MRSSSSIGIVGSSFHLGQTKEGVELGPSCIRNNGLRDLLNQKFFNVFDYGDLHQDFSKEVLWQRGGAFRYLKNLSRKIQVSLKENDFNIHLGGDHSVGMASIHAVKKVYPDAIILWIDAHGDVNTAKQSATKSLHGMPLAACLGMNDAKAGDIWDDFCKHFQCLDPDDLIYLGLRNLDASELVTLREKNIKHFSSRAWQSEQFASEFLAHWDRINPRGERPVYISFDIDAIDPQLASATGVPVDFGVGLNEIHRLFECLDQSCKLIGIDLVELNPKLAKDPKELSQSLSILFYFVQQALKITETKVFFPPFAKEQKLSFSKVFA